MYGGGPGFGVTDARFNMTATVLQQNNDYVPPLQDPDGNDIDIDEYGEWVDSQDPLTGDIIRVWEPYATGPQPVPDNDEHSHGGVRLIGEIPCVARGIVDGGIRVAGTTERFGEEYENVDYVKLWTPSYVFISKRDRITNIRDPHGRIVWVDEEVIDPRTTEAPRATVYNVNGVTPLFDAFNNHYENYVMLERASVVSPSERL